MNSTPDKLTEIKEQVISIIIGLVSIFVSEFVSFFYPEYITFKDSVAIGFFSYIIAIVTFWNKDLKLFQQIPEIASKLDIIANIHLEEKNISSRLQDSFDIFWSLCLIKARAGIYEFHDPYTIRVKREQLPAFWQQAILNTDISWNCTNFVNSPDDLYSNWAKTGFEFQGMVSKTIGVPVKRLFISRNKKDVTAKFIEHMKWQASLGFMIRHINKEKKLKWALLGDLEKLIGTIDIALINGHYLIAFILSDNDPREISILRIHSCPQIVSQVNEIFHHMWDSAVPIDTIDISS